MKSTTIRAALCAATALCAFSTAYAGEAEDALIAKVTAAYGGAKLTNLKSIRIEDEYKSGFPGQGYTPTFVEFIDQKQDAQLDLEGERGSIEGWSDNWNFPFSFRTVSAGDDIVGINYAAGTYQPAAQPDYYTAFGAVIRVSDTLLAYELGKRAETAEIVGENTYTGRPHKVIRFEIPNSPPLTLHVDTESGYISRMTRETGFGALTYRFHDHASAGGIGYAQNFEFFVGKDPNLITVSRKITPNMVRSSVFAIDRGIAEEPARVDTAEMTVDRVADGLHLVGQGPQGGAAAYTAFIDAGDHVIAVGGYAGLQARFDAYKAETGADKPLRYQVATHHHTDHLGGMREAFDLGAIIVTPENAVANIESALGEPLPEDRRMLVEDGMALGPVTIHDVWTNHMESMAVVYVPSAKAVFQADHYTGLYIDEPAPGTRATELFVKALDEAGLEVDTVLSAHGRKAVSWTEIEAAVAALNTDPCPTNRAICR